MAANATKTSKTANVRRDHELATRKALAAKTIGQLRKVRAGCRACDLWKNATQTVFGEGPSPAKIMFVGEQPGDQEDRTGHPFVGPAGRLLDRALEEAGIDRSKVYVTNVVKHFKWGAAERGKRRIHKKPRGLEIQACRPWMKPKSGSCGRKCWCASERQRHRHSWARVFA